MTKILPTKIKILVVKMLVKMRILVRILEDLSVQLMELEGIILELKALLQEELVIIMVFMLGLMEVPLEIGQDILRQEICMLRIILV